MSNAANRQQGMQRRLELIQLSLLLAAAAGFLLTMGWKAGMALIYGGVVVFANERLQRWQLRRAAHIAGNSPAKNLSYLYRCAAERFIATIALFAAGFGLMALPPLPLLSGYIIAQAAVIYRFYQESSLRRRHG
jgi:F0F1-type ATP synthase assembly protein I